MKRGEAARRRPGWGDNRSENPPTRSPPRQSLPSGAPLARPGGLGADHPPHRFAGGGRGRLFLRCVNTVATRGR